MVRAKSRVSGVVVAGPLERSPMPTGGVPGPRLYAAVGGASTASGGRLSRWLQGQELTAEQLDEAQVEAFLAVQRAHGTASVAVVTSGVAVPAGRAAGARRGGGRRSASARVRHRGAAGLVRAVPARRARPGGRHGRAGMSTHARRFLGGLSGRSSWPSWTRARSRPRCCARRSRVSVGAAQYFVAALRAFLRFCFLEGLVAVDLSQAALAVTGRRRSPLPQGISRAEARALLGSLRPAHGARAARLRGPRHLLRLGLRRGEVAAADAGDIDWRAGEIVVHGKGGREDRLPLPADVGAAIAGYLQPRAADQPTAGRCSCGPWRRSRRSTPARCPRSCAAPAGGPGSRVGAHRLRHTMACQMVAAGVPLVEIGQVLRHSSLQSTAIYARVDVEQLRQLAAAVAEGGARDEPRSDDHVDDYLRLRRALGFKLEREGRCCRSSSPTSRPPARHADQRAGDRLGTAARDERSRSHWAHRLGVARGFATYLQTIDPATEIPPAGRVPGPAAPPDALPVVAEPRSRRLLDGAGQLRPPLRAADPPGAVRSARRLRDADGRGDRPATAATSTSPTG